MQVFQKELGKRTGTVQVLKRSGRELIENSRDDTTWVKVQLQELSNRWDTVCKLSVSKQTRLEQALKQVRRKKKKKTWLETLGVLCWALGLFLTKLREEVLLWSGRAWQPCSGFCKELGWVIPRY